MRKSRKAELYAYLRSAILTLELQPGCDLDEASLSSDFELSRTPLREVLRRLAGEGYVDLRENRGARVSEMMPGNLRAFFQAAPMIYGAILRLAAENATRPQIAQLIEAQDIFKDALANGTAADRALANTRFHEITGEMADNPYLLPSLQRLLIDHSRIGMIFYRPENEVMRPQRDAASRQHDEIIAAIEARDSDSAAELAREHWKLARDQIEMFVMPSGLDEELGEMPRRASA